MSIWLKQNTGELRQQAIQRVIAAELDLMAAKGLLSEIETKIVHDYLSEICEVVIGYGVCQFDCYKSGPIDVVIEKIHPISYDDHVRIEFRAFTKKGRPYRQTTSVAFSLLKYFKKKPPATS